MGCVWRAAQEVSVLLLRHHLQELHRCECMQEMYAMLTEFGGKMRPDDEVLFSDMQEGVKAYGTALAEAQAFATEHREGHAEGLSAAAAAVMDSAQNISVDCAAGRYDDASADPAATQAQLADLEQQVCFHAPVARTSFARTELGIQKFMW